ncbi:hypothetical protein DEO72_LG11g1638 [Vigna unguiculata]|uniref:Uncharacterized protein n=1 Tax=Vigna unguiculata TaxID=3917 RepID=A0A4D6NQS8_VIGUN|nr:hypothetical protein DEO72_LG11g1638 [Vigna unguiculata]
MSGACDFTSSLVSETFSLVTIARKPWEPVAKMLLCSSSDPSAALPPVIPSLPPA